MENRQLFIPKNALNELCICGRKGETPICQN